MKTTIALAALAAGLVASPAFASDGGIYIGALAGYEGLKVTSTTGTVSANADSAVYGLNAGYDVKLGTAMLGVEGEISTSNGTTTFPTTLAGAREGLEAKGQYYIGARAGFDLSPSITAYGKVGYTALDTRAFTQSGSLAELKDNADGVRFGGGLQVQLPGPLEARLEYRHSNYSNLADPSQDKAKTDQVVAGIGLRF